MMKLVPTFGIDTYAERMARLMAEGQIQLPVVEGVVLGGLVAAAALLAGVALIRRSAVAAVGFSFVCLVGLVCAVIFGRLNFVPTTTQVLILCLAACGLLLFLTSTVRVARENPVVGMLVLICLAALLVIGGATASGIIDGGPLMRLGLAVSMGLTGLCVIFEILRRDRPTLVIAPGLLMVLGSPFLMSHVGTGTATDWMTVSMPVAVLAGGAFYAAMAAISVVAAARAEDHSHRSAYPMAPMAGAPMAATAMMRDISAEPDHGPSGGADVQPFSDAVASGPIQALDEGGYTPPAEEAYHQEPPSQPRHDYAPVGFDAREAQAEPPAPEPPAPEAAPERPVFGEVAEPVSATWGRSGNRFGGDAMVLVADNEYVWDQLAAQEVKLGNEFASAFGIAHGVVATPDLLRQAVAPLALDVFDEEILGGRQPITGRFDVDLGLADGRVARLIGRRQVDHDGLLIRIEATVDTVDMGAAAAEPAPGKSGGLASFAASPLTASRDGAASEPSDECGILGALERGEIQPYFQPIVRLSDRATVAFEALARWARPDGSVLEAKDFIPQLVEEGHGLQLIRHMVGRSAEELAAWIEAEPGQGQFVSVNIAASDLPKEDLSKIIKSAIDEHQLPPGALVVELTEGRIQASQSKALAAAKALRDAGASLALDDFGAGYSNIHRLSKFHFDLIKTDHSLISDLSNKKARTFFKNLLSTARKKNAPVIAEGIEDEETAHILEELGCQLGQGYLFGRPEPLGEPPAPQQAQAPVEPAAQHRTQPSVDGLR